MQKTISINKPLKQEKLKQVGFVVNDIEEIESIKRLLVNEIGKEAIKYINGFVNFSESSTFYASTTTRFNIDKLPSDKFTNIVNIKKINDIRWINKFFESVNAKLPLGGIYINNVETYTLRKKRILNKYPPVLNHIYYFFDCVLKRLFPKLLFFKQIYFFITKGNNRVLSKAETLGRLYSCGFEILDEKFVNGHFFFIAKKIKEPAFDYHPTYGPIVRLKRVGKNGKIFNVYKMRTMHAYSEYIQNYIFEKNELQKGGKFNNDFRITTLGRIMRKCWIDELPMFINLFKRNMKLVGVRPLSEQYFNLYSKELQEKRIKYKPGLLPPYYADMPKTLDEIQASEMKYLNEYEKHPFKTNVKYFFRILNNIVFKNARSR